MSLSDTKSFAHKECSMVEKVADEVSNIDEVSNMYIYVHQNLNGLLWVFGKLHLIGGLNNERL